MKTKIDRKNFTLSLPGLTHQEQPKAMTSDHHKIEHEKCALCDGKCSGQKTKKKKTDQAHPSY